MNKSKILIGIVILVLLSGCSNEAMDVLNNAQEFCESKGYSNWKWDTRWTFGSTDFYCINKTAFNIEDHYVGIKEK